MSEHAEPAGEIGAQIKQRIDERKREDGTVTEAFDPGAAMLGTDAEAGALPDPEGMQTARDAPPPK